MKCKVEQVFNVFVLYFLNLFLDNISLKTRKAQPMQCTDRINIVINYCIKIFNIVSMCMLYMQHINEKCGMGPLFNMILMKLKLKNT